MADPIDAPRSAMGDHVAAKRYGRLDGAAGVLAAELAGRSIAAIAARPGKRRALADALQQAFGLPLPAAPRREVGQGIAIEWGGPDRWLVIANREPAGGIEAHLASLAGHASIVDQSHGLLQLRVSGPAVRQALAKGVVIDLHPRAFKPGDVAATIVSHIAVTLVMLDDAPSYEILTPRSSALSFWHWLEASAAEFGLAVELARPA